jgi:hypothetical protein
MPVWLGESFRVVLAMADSYANRACILVSPHREGEGACFESNLEPSKGSTGPLIGEQSPMSGAMPLCILHAKLGCSRKPVFS